MSGPQPQFPDLEICEATRFFCAKSEAECALQRIGSLIILRDAEWST